MFVYNLTELPFVNMTGRVREKEGWSHNGRSMKVNMLVYFHSGSCRMTIDGKEYQFKRGDVAIVPRYVYYTPYTANFCEYTFFHFEGDLLSVEMNPDEILPFDEVPHGKPFYRRNAFMEDDHKLLLDYKVSLNSHQQNLDLLVHKCMSTCINYESKQQLLLSIQFSTILFYVSQAFCERFRSSNPLPSQVNKILTYIKEHYTEPISLDDICNAMSMSKQYCMRIFKKYMHITISDYILDLRMRHAAYLLSNTHMNVNQTADYLGFSNTSYFSRVFKKYYGISPSEYVE